MRISFDKDKLNLVFVHETPVEYKKMTGFPGFVKMGIYNCVPASISIAFNVVQRVRKYFKNVQIDRDVDEWLSQPFRLKSIPEGFQYHTKPMDYQEIALRFLYTLGSAGILLDPGMGKSKVVLDYIELMKFKKVLIVCPKALLFVWEDEIETHRPELSYYAVESTDWEIEYPKMIKAQVTVINYTKAVMFKNELKKFGYEFIHLDEFLIKDPKTERTKSLTEIARTIPYRCGGSGTLINNSPLDMFSPIKYLQPSLVGWNYSNFMDYYAVFQQSKTMPNRKVVVAYKGKDEARSILDSCCIVMSKEKWLTLPEKKFNDVYVRMSEEQKETYDCLRSNFITKIPGTDKFVEVDNPLTMMSKLYQIANGFMYHSDEAPDITDILDDSLCEEFSKQKPKKGPRETHYFSHNPKQEALINLTEKLVGRRGIIWYNMSAELKLIEECLSEVGDKWTVIKGGEKKTGDKVREFNRDNSIRWLVCQAKSVNYGITVMGTKKDLESVDPSLVVPELDSRVHTQIFYSINFSLEVYLQQLDRIHRMNQDRVCEYYRIFTNSSVEHRLRQAMDDKMSIRKEMLIDIAKRLSSEEVSLV